MVVARMGPGAEFDFVDYDGDDDADVHELVYNLLGRNDELQRKVQVKNNQIRVLEKKLRELKWKQKGRNN